MSNTATSETRVIAKGETWEFRGPVAALLWCFLTVCIFSAIALLGPILAPLLLDHHFHWTVSFGRGELLGFALGLFAASLSRWIIHGSDHRTLQLVSCIGLAATGIAIGILWTDSFESILHATRHPWFSAQSIVAASLVLSGAAFFLGASTEVLYARMRQNSITEIGP
jgi:hypothetical protein